MGFANQVQAGKLANMWRSHIKGGQGGKSSPLQDTKERQRFWNLAKQSIGEDADCQNYCECDCEYDVRTASE